MSLNHVKLVSNLLSKEAKIAVIGLGYVGRPLFEALVNAGFSILGYDLSEHALSSSAASIKGKYELTSDPKRLSECSVFLVTVPTPVHHGSNAVDLECLTSASKAIGENAVGEIVVVYESTAYPGITREMVKVIADASKDKLIPEKNLHWGYSPERITPGDDAHRIHNTNKIVSGYDKPTANFVAWLYSRVVTHAKLHVASVEVAEAAKVVENVQRDVNIALMNDLTKGFHKLGISIREVVEAAGTKWNFGKYSPGLVGGHCIAVDPWYLEHKFNTVGVTSEIIRTARKVSDSIPQYIVDSMLARLHNDRRSVILQYGLTYKPDVCDWRDSRAIELARLLSNTFEDVRVADHLIQGAGFTGHRDFLGLEWYSDATKPKFLDAIVLAVPHKEHLTGFVEMIDKMAPPVDIIDICGVLDPSTIYKTGHTLWTL